MNVVVPVSYRQSLQEHSVMLRLPTGSSLPLKPVWVRAQRARPVLLTSSWCRFGETQDVLTRA